MYSMVKHFNKLLKVNIVLYKYLHYYWGKTIQLNCFFCHLPLNHSYYWGYFCYKDVHKFLYFLEEKKKKKLYIFKVFYSFFAF